MRVIIVSNQPLCREALRGLVTEHLQPDLVQMANGLDGLLDADEPADLLLLDLPASVDPNDWVLAAERVAAIRRVLAAPERNLALARIAYAHGVQGLLPKNSEPALLGAILKLVMAGGEYFPCFDEINETPAHAGHSVLEGLTKRQREVLDQMHRGRTNKEIAKLLGVSVATVKLHVQAILSVTGARNRTEAVSRFISSDG